MFKNAIDRLLALMGRPVYSYLINDKFVYSKHPLVKADAIKSAATCHPDAKLFLQHPRYEEPLRIAPGMALRLVGWTPVLYTVDPSPPKSDYTYFVDGIAYDTTFSTVTEADIRATAGIHDSLDLIVRLPDVKTFELLGDNTVVEVASRPVNFFSIDYNT